MAPKLERALTTVGIEHDVKTYPEAGHSFGNHASNGPALMRPLVKVLNVGPEPASAADAWPRIEVFFAEHFGPERS